MARIRRGGGGEGLNPWPGYVDALSTLLMVIIFVLLVFVLAQAFLSASLYGRQQAMTRLQQQVADLSSMLSVQQGQANDLRAEVGQIGRDLRATVAERDTLSRQLDALRAEQAQVAAQRTALQGERDTLAAQLATAQVQAQATQQRLAQVQALADASSSSNQAAEAKVAAAASDLAQTQSQLAAARARLEAMQQAAEAADQTITTDRATLQAKLSDLASLAQQVQALTALRDQLERQAQDAAVRATTEQQRRQAVAAQLATEQKLADSDKAQMAVLTQQVQALRDQLSGVQAALGATQTQVKAKDVQIADLGQKLNVALAQKVQELQRYRSEFFGKLGSILAGRAGVQVVGDRFVFQSEVLFPPGSADLNGPGLDEIEKLAATLKQIIPEIPPDVNWLLRIDGHADKQPVDQYGYFKDNWDLSAQRSINVVKRLIADGIPADRLAAAAFGDTEPLDPAATPEAYARNRRIEIRLTDR
jgi:chemotaxis protein MotB